MKTALITGSSRGIGKAIALQLARDGFRIFVHYARDHQKAEAVCNEIAAVGAQVEAIQCDLSSPKQAQQLFEKTGAVDVLILNASIQHRTHWREITLDACYEQLDCNFVSSLVLMQAYVGPMIENQWGRIITIGSVQEKKPHPDMLVYAASKAAQTNMAVSLAAQLAQYGITVNNIAPGVINTDRNKEALSDLDYAKKVTAGIPVGFYGEPEDISGIVSLLCSERGSYITGQSIFVDGGKSI